MNKNWIGPLVSCALIGLLYFLLKDQFPAIVSALKNGNHGLIGLAALIFLSTTVILARRLQLIFDAEDVKIKLRETLSLTYIGYFFNNFLPTSVGGDIVKAMCASKVTGQRIKSITTVMMDRIFGLFTFILIPSFSMLLLKDKIDPRVPVMVYSFLTFSIIFFFLLFNRSIAKRFHIIENVFNKIGIGTKIRQIYDGMHNFRNHKAVVIQAMVLSMIGQSIGIFCLYMLAVAIGADKGVWMYFFLLVPIVHLISMLPSINGLGIREGAYIYFLKSYIGTEKAAAIGILWLGLTILVSVIGGFVYFIRRDYHIEFKNAKQEIA